MNKVDCFAYINLNNGVSKCDCLKEINCKGCKFYKSKDDVKNNVLMKLYKEKRLNLN